MERAVNLAARSLGLANVEMTVNAARTANARLQEHVGRLMPVVLTRKLLVAELMLSLAVEEH